MGRHVTHIVGLHHWGSVYMVDVSLPRASLPNAQELCLGEISCVPTRISHLVPFQDNLRGFYSLIEVVSPSPLMQVLQVVLPQHPDSEAQFDQQLAPYYQDAVEAAVEDWSVPIWPT